MIFRRATLALAAAACASLAAPATAGDDQRVVGANPTATDIASTPVRDLNLDHKDVPAILLKAEDHTYAPMPCGAARGEIARLNAVLGPDFDTQQREGHRYTPGHLAQSVVDSLIPFGGIIKEVSGAAAKQRRLQVAVYAGFARRAFLKGACHIRG